MRSAKRIGNLPPYIFAELDRKVASARSRGVDVISFGVGDPDQPTPAHIVEALVQAAGDPATHRYPSYYGMEEFRNAIAAYYQRRFGVELDPQREVVALIGSKEGIAHLATAFVDPGDVVLVPDPGYPVYETSALLAGGEVRRVPLFEEGGYLPHFVDISARDAARAKVLWLNYPSNPTCGVAGTAFFADAVAFAQNHDLLIAHDAAYAEITYDGYVAPSILQVPGAMGAAIEFGSLSKTYNMTGWRIGWAAGSAEAIEALGRVKTNIDSGVWTAVQRAGIAALNGPQDCVAQMCALYQGRRDRCVETLGGSGWEVPVPKGAIYLWAPAPAGLSGGEFAALLLERAGVVVAPGGAYGLAGDAYVRLSLTVPDDLIDKGLGRIAHVIEEGW